MGKMKQVKNSMRKTKVNHEGGSIDVLTHPEFDDVLQVYIDGGCKSGTRISSQSSNIIFTFNRCGKCPLLHIILAEMTDKGPFTNMAKVIAVGMFDDTLLSQGVLTIAK